jgi:hypothetical protein
MKSSKHGKSISKAEVLGINPHGLWLLVNGKKYELPSADFPWFWRASMNDICRVELLHHNHLYWPSLDIDLAVESLTNLEKYPLIADRRLRSKTAAKAAA